MADWCINCKFDNQACTEAPCNTCTHNGGTRNNFISTDDELEYLVNDVVNRPTHYTDGKIEVIEYIEDKKLGFCLGNAIKYISRAGKKDPTKEIEDLKKAKWYIERRIKELEEARE